jgi:predicted RNA-binding Zn-ribbon protein involved in translation (DUF1610 family)
MAEVACNSCKKNVTNLKGTVLFKCPKCTKVEIVRCSHCRQVAIKYQCPECGFIGPN